MLNGCVSKHDKAWKPCNPTASLLQKRNHLPIRYIFIYEYSDFKGGLGDAKDHSQHAFAGLQAFQNDMTAALADSLSISSIHITLTVSACQWRFTWICPFWQHDWDVWSLVQHGIYISHLVLFRPSNVQKPLARTPGTSKTVVPLARWGHGWEARDEAPLWQPKDKNWALCNLLVGWGGKIKRS